MRHFQIDFEGQDLKPAPDGGFIVVGYTEKIQKSRYDDLLARFATWAKFDVNFQNIREVQSSQSEGQFTSISVAKDGGAFIGGSELNEGRISPAMLRVDAQGRVQWKKVYKELGDQRPDVFSSTNVYRSFYQIDAIRDGKGILVSGASFYTDPFNMFPRNCGKDGLHLIYCTHAVENYDSWISLLNDSGIEISRVDLPRDEVLDFAVSQKREILVSTLKKIDKVKLNAVPAL